MDVDESNMQYKSMFARSQPPSNRSFSFFRNRISFLNTEKKNKHNQISADFLKRISNKKMGVNRHLSVSSLRFDRTVHNTSHFEMPFNVKNGQINWHAHVKVSGSSSSSVVEMLQLSSLWEKYRHDNSYSNPENIRSMLSSLVSKSASLRNVLGSDVKFAEILNECTNSVQSHHRKFYINSQCAGSPMDFAFDSYKMRIFQAQFVTRPDNFLHQSKCFVFVGPLYPTTSFGDNDCNMNLAFGCVVRCVTGKLAVEGSYNSKIDALKEINGRLASGEAVDLHTYNFLNILEAIYIPSDLLAVHVDWGYPFNQRLGDNAEWTCKFQPTSESFDYRRQIVCKEAFETYELISEHMKSSMAVFLNASYFEDGAYSGRSIAKKVINFYLNDVKPFHTRFLEHKHLLNSEASKICQVMYNNYMIPFAIQSIRTNMRIQLLKTICFSKIAQVLYSQVQDKADENIGIELFQDEEEFESDDLINQDIVSGNRGYKPNISFEQDFAVFKSAGTEKVHTVLAAQFDCSPKVVSKHARLNYINDRIASMLHIQYGLHAFGYGMSKFQTHQEEIATLEKLIRLYFICFEQISNLDDKGTSYEKQFLSTQALATEIEVIFKAVDDALNIFVTTSDENNNVHIQFSDQKSDSTNQLLQNLHNMQPFKVFKEGKIGAEEILSCEIVKPAILLRARIPMSMDTTRIHCSLHELRKFNRCACDCVETFLPCTPDYYPMRTDAFTKISPVFGKDQLDALSNMHGAAPPCWVVCDFDCDTRNMQFKVMHHYDKNPYQETSFDHMPMNVASRKGGQYNRQYFDKQVRSNVFNDPSSGGGEQLISAIEAKFAGSNKMRANMGGNQAVMVTKGENYVMGVVGGNYMAVWTGIAPQAPVCMFSFTKDQTNVENVVNAMKSLLDSSPQQQNVYTVSKVQVSVTQSDGSNLWTKVKGYFETLQETFSTFSCTVQDDGKRIYFNVYKHPRRVLQITSDTELTVTTYLEVGVTTKFSVSNDAVAQDNELKRIFKIYLELEVSELTMNDVYAAGESLAGKEMYELVKPSFQVNSSGDFLTFTYNGVKKRLAIPDPGTQKAKQDLANLIFGLKTKEIDVETLHDIFKKVSKPRPAARVHAPHEGKLSLIEGGDGRQVQLWLEFHQTAPETIVSAMWASVKSSETNDFSSKAASDSKYHVVFSKENVTEEKISEFLQKCLDNNESLNFLPSFGTIKVQPTDTPMPSRTADYTPAPVPTPPAGKPPPAPPAVPQAEAINLSSILDEAFKNISSGRSDMKIVTAADQSSAGQFLASNPLRVGISVHALEVTSPLTDFISYRMLSGVQPVSTILVCSPQKRLISVGCYLTFLNGTKLNYVNMLPKNATWKPYNGDDSNEFAKSAVREQVTKLIRCLQFWKWPDNTPTHVVKKESFWRETMDQIISQNTLAIKGQYANGKYNIYKKNDDTDIGLVLKLSDEGLLSVETTKVPPDLLIQFKSFAGPNQYHTLQWRVLKVIIANILLTLTESPNGSFDKNEASLVDNILDGSRNEVIIPLQDTKRVKAHVPTHQELLHRLNMDMQQMLQGYHVRCDAGGIHVEKLDEKYERIPLYSTTVFAATGKLGFSGPLWKASDIITMTTQPNGYINADPICQTILSKYRGFEAAGSAPSVIPDLTVSDLVRLVENALSTVKSSEPYFSQARFPVPDSSTFSFGPEYNNIVIRCQIAQDNTPTVVLTHDKGDPMTIVFDKTQPMNAERLLCEYIHSLLLERLNTIWLEQHMKNQESLKSLSIASFLAQVLNPLVAALNHNFQDTFSFQVVTDPNRGVCMMGADALTQRCTNNFYYCMTLNDVSSIQFGGFDGVDDMGIAGENTMNEINASIIRASVEKPDSLPVEVSRAADFLTSIFASRVPSAASGSQDRIEQRMDLESFRIGFMHPLMVAIEGALSRHDPNHQNFVVSWVTMPPTDPRFPTLYGAIEIFESATQTNWAIWANSDTGKAFIETVNFSQPVLGPPRVTINYQMPDKTLPVTSDNVGIVFCTCLMFYQGMFDARASAIEKSTQEAAQQLDFDKLTLTGPGFSLNEKLSIKNDVDDLLNKLNFAI